MRHDQPHETDRSGERHGDSRRERHRADRDNHRRARVDTEAFGLVMAELHDVELPAEEAEHGHHQREHGDSCSESRRPDFRKRAVEPFGEAGELLGRAVRQDEPVERTGKAANDEAGDDDGREVRPHLRVRPVGIARPRRKPGDNEKKRQREASAEKARGGENPRGKRDEAELDGEGREKRASADYAEDVRLGERITKDALQDSARHGERRADYERRRYRKSHFSLMVPFSTAMKADCGTFTWPNSFILALPRFCFSRTFILRVTSPP